MQTVQGQILRSLHAVADFLTTNAERLPRAARSGAFERLTRIIAHLEQFIAAQSGGALSARGLTRRNGELRAALVRDHMMPIASIARIELATRPEMEALRMPRGEPSVERLVAHARGMADAAEPVAEVFIAQGLSSDFIVELRAAATSLIDAVTRRNAVRVEAVEATVGIEDSLRRGRRLVHVLDALVRVDAARDQALLAGWISARHVERRRGRAAARRAEVSDEPALPITNPMRLLSAAPEAAGVLEDRTAAREAEHVMRRTAS